MFHNTNNNDEVASLQKKKHSRPGFLSLFSVIIS